MVPGGFWTFSKKCQKLSKKSHLENQKTNLRKTFLCTPEAETKTVDSSRYFLKKFLSDFLDVLKTYLISNCEGRHLHLAW